MSRSVEARARRSCTAARTLFAILAVGIAGVAAAQAPTVVFRGASVANAELRSYACNDHRHVEVSYIDTVEGDSLAMLAIDGHAHIFVAALAASGVRYVSGPYVWWTKGSRASLKRDDDGDGKPLLADCALVIPPKTAPRDAFRHAGN
jgi:membrane-bound inhibitor of C-type lysozyme